ncbi:MAG: hypothetical protein MRY83_24820 [Flavobacteriales bacterium]|nr:hypothetical protein [Flavobacteriales bacterium]
MSIRKIITNEIILMIEDFRGKVRHTMSESWYGEHTNLSGQKTDVEFSIGSQTYGAIIIAKYEDFDKSFGDRLKTLVHSNLKTKFFIVTTANLKPMLNIAVDKQNVVVPIFSVDHKVRLHKAFAAKFQIILPTEMAASKQYLNKMKNLKKTGYNVSYNLRKRGIGLQDPMNGLMYTPSELVYLGVQNVEDRVNPYIVHQYHKFRTPLNKGYLHVTNSGDKFNKAYQLIQKCKIS